MFKNKKIALCISIIAFVLVLCSCNASTNRIKNNTTIDGIDISNLSEAEAKNKLQSHYNSLLDDTIITIQADRTHRYSAEELGFSVNFGNALNSALGQGWFSRANSYKSEIVLNDAVAREMVEKIATRINADPKGASAEYKDGEIVFVSAQNGKRLDIENLLEQLSSKKDSIFSESLNVDAKIDEVPNSSNVNIDELQTNYSLLAEYTTSFTKGPLNAENRVKNIIKAAKLVDGTIVKSGKEFNTNKVLGDRNKENGWYKAPAIRDGKYNLEYGGGVCQISSTLYNAVLLANLEVVERQPHTWPMSYVPIGLDATISTDGINFRFKNSTESDIIVSAIVDKKAQTITVRLFGKAEGNYSRVEITSKKTETIPEPEVEYIEDSTIEKGKEVKERKAREGLKTVTIRIFYGENGNEISRETVSEDTYRAISARVRVGV